VHPVSTSSITVQSLGGGNRTMRAGCRCENVVFVTMFLPARHDSIAQSLLRQRVWLGGCLTRCPSHAAFIVTKRLILSENFFNHLKAPSFYFLETPRRYTIPREPFSGGVKHGGIGDFRVIFDGYGRLSRKRCEIGRWLL